MVVKKKRPQSEPPDKIDWKPYVVLLALFMSGLILLFYGDDITKLSPERRQKLEKELDELENAEQYALIAAIDGWYPCFHCKNTNRIFLLKGEIWRYGVTRKGEKERYGTGLLDRRLIYTIQYTGQLQECLKREKIKIYTYAILSENLKRPHPLIRPPGASIQTLIVWETNEIPDENYHHPHLPPRPDDRRKRSPSYTRSLQCARR